MTRYAMRRDLSGGGECGCYVCASKRPSKFMPGASEANDRMIVCPKCGNKRCPHATHHAEGCTNSNAAGQPGSRYE